MKLLVIDCETTGLDNYPLNHEVIEVAACVWEDGVRGPLWVKRFMPCGPVDPGAAKVNGFRSETWGELQEKTGVPCRAFSFEDAKTLYEMAVPPGGETCAMFLGANTRFDLDFLKEAFRRVRHPFPTLKKHRLLDVQSIAFCLQLAEKIEDTALVRIAEFYGLSTAAQHSAAGDVDMTIKVFERLCFDALDGFHHADGKRAGLSDVT